VPPGDADALAIALRRLLGDDALRRRLAAAGRERVLRRFTWEQAARGTVQCYREAIAASPAVHHRRWGGRVPGTATERSRPKVPE
jgi:hypothetical protein